MTSLKHYHLGCGEPLLSHRWEFRKLNSADFLSAEKPKRKPATAKKKVKQL